VLCAALAAPVRAEEPAEGESSPAKERAEGESPAPGQELEQVPLAPSTGVRLHGEEYISVLADFGPAEASEYRSNLNLRAVAPIGESFALRFNLSGHASFFDYSGDRDQLELDLGGLNLFERLYGAQLSVAGIYRLPFEWTVLGVTPAWSLFGEGRGNMNWENGASLADAAKGSGALGFGLELGENFEIGAGVSVGSRIDEGGVSVSPVFALRWKFCDRWRLQGQGSGLMLGYELTPELELQLRGGYESDRYRLHDAEGPVENLTLRQREAPVLLALRWSPTRHWRLTGGAGSVVYQQWRVEEDDDGVSNKVTADPSALLWLRVEYRF